MNAIAMGNPLRWRWLTSGLLVMAASSAGAQLGLVGSEVFSFLTEGARYGAAVAIGDLNGDGLGDLAVGLPTADFAGLNNPGRVTLYVSNPDGLGPRRDPDRLASAHRPRPART